VEKEGARARITLSPLSNSRSSIRMSPPPAIVDDSNKDDEGIWIRRQDFRSATVTVSDAERRVRTKVMDLPAARVC